MAANIPACFFMLCTDNMEKECLDRGLFGHGEPSFPFLRSVKKGDVGFLLNVSRDELLGVFVAESDVRLNIVPQAWRGAFPTQVKVKLLGKLQRISATSNLEKHIELRLMKGRNYKIPSKSTYGPDITEKVLTLFKLTEGVVTAGQSTAVPEAEVVTEHSFQDVAGLLPIKEFIYQRIIAPFEDEETAYRLRLRLGGGMLLVGPPGTGKTLVASAIARHMQAKFEEISPSVVIGFPGEAEKRIENIFTSLDREPRAVLFLDEAEWILCKREEQSSSVMQRITPVLLAQLSRIFKQKAKAIVVVAATNKPEMIDPAFFRPGRFDKIFVVDLPDEGARRGILNLQRQGRANDLSENDISDVAARLEGYSGADIENILEEAAFAAFDRRSKNTPAITRQDVIAIVTKTPRSVTTEEVQKIKRWAQQRGLNQHSLE